MKTWSKFALTFALVSTFAHADKFPKVVEHDTCQIRMLLLRSGNLYGSYGTDLASDAGQRTIESLERKGYVLSEAFKSNRFASPEEDDAGIDVILSQDSGWINKLNLKLLAHGISTKRISKNRTSTVDVFIMAEKSKTFRRSSKFNDINSLMELIEDIPECRINPDIPREHVIRN